MCLTPVTLKRDYRKLDGTFTNVVPCGKCPACLRKRQHEWSFRLWKESKVSESACFLTLTYDVVPLSFNGLPTLRKRDLQLFWKRLRKNVRTKIKYYAVGEYGGLGGRPHYHAIVFNLPQSHIQNPDLVSQIWNQGLVHCGTVNIRSIAYTCGYIMQGTFQPVDDFDDREPHYSAMSKNLGESFLTPQMVRHLRARLEGVATMPGGFKICLPRYYKNRNLAPKVPKGQIREYEPLFSKEQRDTIHEAAILARELNIEKLFNNDGNKQITWKKDQFRKAKKELKSQRPNMARKVLSHFEHNSNLTTKELVEKLIMSRA